VHDSSSLDGVYGVSHRWTRILVLYLRRFGYFLRTNNFLAGRTVMSPIWDIIILHSVMMTKVASWGL
jgi:hypothetical protein